MIVGVIKEIKNTEGRVALTPAGAKALVQDGHKVLIEKSAGLGSGFDDNSYLATGAEIIDSNKTVFELADMILKVKEPQPSEYDLLREGQILFTYLHLAAEPELTKALMKNKVVSISYETVQMPDGTLPLLAPMSEIAGRMATQVGAETLTKHKGGKGVLLSGIPGVAPAKVAIIGGGVVGINAAKIAVGMGADVTIIDISPKRLRAIDDIFNFRIKTVMSNSYNLMEAVKESDLVISGVLLPGAKAPKLITEEMVMQMSPGSVIVDVAIDQGGSVETIDHSTTHDNPTFEKHGVIHYSVANMPGAVARTSTLGLTNCTLPYVLKIANKGYAQAIADDESLAKGVNVLNGKVVYKDVAVAFGLEYVPMDEAIKY